MRRLRTLTEAECYARCYGDRGGDGVRAIRFERRRPRFPVLASGEELRTRFEQLLDAREPEDAEAA